MFIKLNSDIVINTNYIVAIEPHKRGYKNNKGNEVKHLLCMVDGQQYFATEEDYYEISKHVY